MNSLLLICKFSIQLVKICIPDIETNNILQSSLIYKTIISFLELSNRNITFNNMCTFIYDYINANFEVETFEETSGRSYEHALAKLYQKPEIPNAVINWYKDHNHIDYSTSIETDRYFTSSYRKVTMQVRKVTINIDKIIDEDHQFPNSQLSYIRLLNGLIICLI